MNEEDKSVNVEESQLAAYRIELESFQGPLDLLLHLIRKNELDIYAIPIAEITNQYLAYLHQPSCTSSPGCSCRLTRRRKRRMVRIRGKS
jgi:hypothetical protein